VNHPSIVRAASLRGQHFASDNYAGAGQQVLDYRIGCHQSGHEVAYGEKAVEPFAADVRSLMEG